MLLFYSQPPAHTATHSYLDPVEITHKANDVDYTWFSAAVLWGERRNGNSNDDADDDDDDNDNSNNNNNNNNTNNMNPQVYFRSYR